MNPIDSGLGRLKNGNRSGDFRCAPRCGARTRRNTSCACPALKGKSRCRLHGGLSTGPRTPEGLARSRRARWIHGKRSEAARTERAAYRALLEEFADLVRHLDQVEEIPS